MSFIGCGPQRRLRTKRLPPLSGTLPFPPSNRAGISLNHTGEVMRSCLIVSCIALLSAESFAADIERPASERWPRAMFVLMAGGGFKAGQVIGASDEKGMVPASEGYSPDDVAASFYRNLGIDHTKEYHEATGRPVMIVRNGNVIPELFA